MERYFLVQTLANLILMKLCLADAQFLKYQKKQFRSIFIIKRFTAAGRFLYEKAFLKAPFYREWLIPGK